jgi:hypothetical protein
MPVGPLVDGNRLLAAEINHAFNPLYRGSNAHGKVAGKGLCVARASRIVEHLCEIDHKGTISHRGTILAVEKVSLKSLGEAYEPSCGVDNGGF